MESLVCKCGKFTFDEDKMICPHCGRINPEYLKDFKTDERFMSWLAINNPTIDIERVGKMRRSGMDKIVNTSLESHGFKLDGNGLYHHCGHKLLNFKKMRIDASSVIEILRSKQMNFCSVCGEPLVEHDFSDTKVSVKDYCSIFADELK